MQNLSTCCACQSVHGNAMHFCGACEAPQHTAGYQLK